MRFKNKDNATLAGRLSTDRNAIPASTSVYFQRTSPEHAFLLGLTAALGIDLGATNMALSLLDGLQATDDGQYAESLAIRIRAALAHDKETPE